MGTNSRTKANQVIPVAEPQELEPEATLQLLHTLGAAGRAILAASSDVGAGEAALAHIRQLLPDYLGGCVLTISQSDRAIRPLACDSERHRAAWTAWGQAVLEEPLLRQRLEAESGLVLPNSSDFLDPFSKSTTFREAPVCLCLPLQAEQVLIGLLLIACGPTQELSGIVQPALQLLAGSLSAALQHSSQRKGELQLREVAEAMRDIMAALASAGNLNQTLQIVLVNLRNVIQYDRAGLYLLDENQRYVLAEKPRPGQERSIRTNQADDPLVAALQQTKAPILVDDIQADPRFEAWPDMQSVRGWLGSPLFVGEEMLGFLSLGSLEPAGFGEADAAMIQAFTRQIAQVLENAWLQEQSHRRSEELEVLSTLTFALGEAESRESILPAIVDQIKVFLDAGSGTFLSSEDLESALVVKFSQDDSLVGRQHPQGDDLLWQVLEGGEVTVLHELAAFLSRNPHGLYLDLFQDMQSAVLVPLRSNETTIGLLCFTFQQRRSFSSKDVNLIAAIAEIAAASLRRALVLEALEEKVNLRTRHLSTLYDLNAISNEPLALQNVLERLLAITLKTMGLPVGAIHLLDPAGDRLYLAAHQNLDPDLLPLYATLRFKTGFWKDLVSTSNPLILADLRREDRLPEGMRLNAKPGLSAYIGAPIRAKGQPLGLLSIFGESILDYTIDDITLFMTIADQIGISVERARLIGQSELAAVIEERQRLARELHDSVTQLIYSQVLFAGAGLKALEQGKIDLLERHLKRLDQGALQALKEMRLLVFELRPSEYLEVGLATALQNRLDAVEKRTGMDASLVIEGELNLDESTEMALYRIAQEALNNTLKHAGAHSVSIHLNTLPDRLRLKITDDGCGFDLDQGIQAGGMGLISMAERADAIGGMLEIQTAPGSGTRITLTVEEVE